MLLRWRTGVVVGGGSGVGREVCLRLARAGAGVLVVDPDPDAAGATAALLRERRVPAWALPADAGALAAEDVDLPMVAARARDLGGADLLVTVGVPAEGAARLGALLHPAPLVHPVPPVAGGPGALAAAVLGVLRGADERAGLPVLVVPGEGRSGPGHPGGAPAPNRRTC